MIFRKSVFAVALSFFMTAPALADCDPVKILIQDQLKLQTDTNTTNQTNTTQSSTTTKDQNLDSTYYGFGAVTENESQKFSDAINNQFHLDYRSSSKLWETYLNLSDNARGAYDDCLKASDVNIFITPDKSVKADSSTVLLRVKVRNYIQQSQQIAMESHFKSDQEALSADDATQTLYPNSSAVFNLKRDATKPLTFTAKVGSESAAYVIPPQDPFITKTELRYSKSVTSYGHPTDSSHDTHNICIEIDQNDDAVIYPSSVQFTALKNVQRDIIHTMNPEPYSPGKVCMYGSQNIRANGADLAVCGYLTAAVIVRVRRDIGHSSYAPPAYLNDPKTCKP